MKVLTLTSRMGEPRHAQALQVNYWFWERGYDVIPFERAELLSGSMDQRLIDEAEETIVYGSVAVIRDALQQAKRPLPPNIDFPAELQDFLGRTISESTMSDVRELLLHKSPLLPLHVKPRDRQKLFKGRVVRRPSDLIDAAGVPNEEPVICQEVVPFTSEWRATILRNRVVHVANYKGNPLQFPDPEAIQSAVALFTQQPIGFGMDWGVTQDGRTLLVEVNDGYALGNYGTPGYLYTAMIECRWRELMGLKDNGVGWAP